ncbi:hypothetical protein K461DRAFT_280471 [Myriangium duriaei CBS 260.36]|uniref:Anaphase-promoting complex subunit 5 n=1 Tax=Myriangium duriaei CBS 260.36 TaxID=1168546 RepID=A0A9P4IV18_9PEZI|nr:hypothetical protein K461DRAFT_280471 [Myriangium duriaei CBS 260.36]
MSRYLSPVKICIVILIDVYFHREAQPIDTIHLLAFISQHVLNRADTPSDGRQNNQITDLKPFESLLSPLTSNFPGRSLHDVFLKYLWALSSFEKLDDLFEKSRSGGVEATPDCLPITPTSSIGQFLRRCHLEFVRLQFSDAQQLWEDFVIFREPSWSAWASRNPDDAAILLQLEGGDMGQISPVLIDRQNKRRNDRHETLASQDVLTQTIQYQLEILQSTGCRLPSEMQLQLAGMIQHASIAPADVHFIKFFDTWRCGAYSDAIDCLHRYFDYAVEGHGSSQNIKTYHQYALLHLAVLHADFGCYEEAIAAMNECIATARENQDSRCLNFGLSWLVHLRKAHPEYAAHEKMVQGAAFGGNESDILLFLQQKALESKDWTQLSSAILSQAESVVQDSGNLPKALEFSYQSAHLNLKHSIRSLQPTQTRLHGALFGLAGAQNVADFDTSVFHTVHAHKATQPELLGMKCMQAYHLVAQGRYDQAMQTLRDADPTQHRTLRMQNLHLGFANMVRFKRALHRNEMFTAWRLLSRIKVMRGMAEPDVAFETHILELEYLRKADKANQAFERVTQLIEKLNESNDNAQTHRIRLLICKANLWAHVGKPAKGFSVALRAANAAYTRTLTPLMWSAVAALAAILDHMQEFAAARKLLDSIIPRAIEGGDVLLIARLYSQLTDAYVGQACQDYKKGSKERDQLLNAAQMYLERAKGAFTRVEDVDGTLSCLERKAMLFRYRGEDVLAEEMDKMLEAEVDQARKREAQVRGFDEESR